MVEEQEVIELEIEKELIFVRTKNMILLRACKNKAKIIKKL